MRSLIPIGLLLVSTATSAAELRDLRLWDSPEGTRVVFEFSAAPRHNVFTLENPDRIVIDLPDSTGARLANKVIGKGEVAHVRASQREDGSLRVVLDMSVARQARSFLLEPAADYGHRLILDLQDAGFAAKSATASVPAAKPPVPVMGRAMPSKPIVVAIDAGHGGEDPGASGHGGLQEKEVALSISRKLAALIDLEPGYRAVLTRDGDYYLGLRERMDRARKAQADLFVSVHANAVTNRRARGSSVYVVSPRGASNEHARWLAQKENAADLVGGIEIDSKDDELKSVLIDLSQSSTMEASFDVGGRMLRALGSVNTLQKNVVQQAGFMVLKAPDIPSVLVETAFITNAQEERLLGSASYQDRIALSLLKGIQGYFDSYRPRDPGTVEPRDPGTGSPREQRKDGPRLQKVKGKPVDVSNSGIEPRR
ncbi:MAG: N-acetylmuramoyl-L-alanine amidase [Panacagrimonas sp.]